MKRIVPRIILKIFVALFLCFVTYFLLPQEVKWVLRSVVDIPVCTSRIADKLNIQPDFSGVKDYIIGSLDLGMTSDEVEKTLSQFAPTSMINTFIDDEQGTHQDAVIKLCDNPLGNVLIYLYYSKEGRLINFGDPYEE